MVTNHNDDMINNTIKDGVSVTEQSVIGRSESTIKGARFNKGQKHSNIINLGVVPKINFDNSQEIQSSLLKSTQGMLENTAAAKVVTNNEAKARNFIEK